MTTTESDWLQQARSLDPTIGSFRDEAERQRYLPVALVEALRSTGMFSFAGARRRGRCWLKPGDLPAVVEALACCDGATGRVVAVVGGGLHASFLPAAGALDIFNGKSLAARQTVLSPVTDQIQAVASAPV